MASDPVPEPASEPGGESFRETLERYRADPSQAVAVMGAVCDSPLDDRKRWTVSGSPAMTDGMAAGLHPATGGDGSAPCPGELLCMTLASCMDGLIRGLAHALKIELESIRVEVFNRGNLRELYGLTDGPAPDDLGLKMSVDVRACPGQDDASVAALLELSEQNSSILNLVRQGAPVSVTLTHSIAE